MKLLRRLAPELIALLVVTVAIYFSSRAMFHEGFFRTIDDVTTVRIDHLARELRRGFWLENFPVRQGGELAYRYGYFFYLFYSPLVYYAGAVLMLVGHLSDIMATKAVYALPLIIGPLLFYWAARQKVGRFPAAVGAFFFALFPFRGFDAYWRGGVGENWAIMFLPGLFAGLFLLEKKALFGRIITAVFLALLVTSHNVAGLMVIPIVLLYGIAWLHKSRQFWFSFLLGLGLSAFFWLPMVYYLPLISANSTPLNTTFVLSTLLPLWELIKLGPAYLPGQYVVPGFFYLITLGLIVFLRYPGKLKTFGLFWCSLNLGLYFLLSSPSLFLWQLTLPISRTLQFSWRVLIILSFTLPLSLSYLISAINSKFVKLSLSGLIIIFSLSFLPSFRPREYSYFYSYSADDSSHCGTTTFEEYFPSWVGQCVNQAQSRELFLTHPAQLVLKENRVLSLLADYSSTTPNTIMVHKYYFPGWHLQVDGAEVVIDYHSTDSGIITAPVPAGEHRLRIYYTKTRLMWLADVISLLSLLVTTGLSIKLLVKSRWLNHHA